MTFTSGPSDGGGPRITPTVFADLPSTAATQTATRRFVRSAWTLLLFQLMAAIAAVAVTGWAALQVAPLLQQRQLLQHDIAALGQTRTQLTEEIAQLQAGLTYERQEARVRAAPVIREGINQYQHQKYDPAIEAYNRALALDPGNAYVLDLRSYSQFKKGDIEAAISSVQAALAADPTYTYGYKELVRYACADSRFDLAERTYTDSIARFPGLTAQYAQLLQDDGEFRRLCAPIQARMQLQRSPLTRPAPPPQPDPSP